MKKRKVSVHLCYEHSLWSEWRDLNSRPLDPQSSALPTAPHPDILFWLRFRNSTNAIITQKPEMSSNFFKKIKVFYFKCFLWFSIDKQLFMMYYTIALALKSFKAVIIKRGEAYGQNLNLGNNRYLYCSYGCNRYHPG